MALPLNCDRNVCVRDRVEMRTRPLNTAGRRTPPPPRPDQVFVFMCNRVGSCAPVIMCECALRTSWRINHRRNDACECEPPRNVEVYRRINSIAQFERVCLTKSVRLAFRVLWLKLRTRDRARGLRARVD